MSDELVTTDDAAILNWLLAHSFPNGDNIGWGAGCEQQRPDIIRGEIIDAMNGWHGHCQFCDGSGQDDRGYEACVRCKGKGNIADLRKEDIFDYYEALSEKFAAPPVTVSDEFVLVPRSDLEQFSRLIRQGGYSGFADALDKVFLNKQQENEDAVSKRQRLDSGTNNVGDLSVRTSGELSSESAPPATPPAAQPSNALSGHAEFQLYCDDEPVACAEGPRADALREINHYALQYNQDGTVRIEEVIRKPLSAIEDVGSMRSAADALEAMSAGGKA